MSNLAAFAAQKLVIRRDDPDHALFMSYVAETFDNWDAVTVMVTQGRELLQVCGFSDQDRRELMQTPLTAGRRTFTLELDTAMLDEPQTVTGFLLMAAGRVTGNYLRAESLDGEGGIAVRFGQNAEVTFERTKTTSNTEGLSYPLVAFSVSVFCSAGRIGW